MGAVLSDQNMGPGASVFRQGSENPDQNVGSEDSGQNVGSGASVFRQESESPDQNVGLEDPGQNIGSGSSVFRQESKNPDQNVGSEDPAKNVGCGPSEVGEDPPAQSSSGESSMACLNSVAESSSAVFEHRSAALHRRLVVPACPSMVSSSLIHVKSSKALSIVSGGTGYRCWTGTRVASLPLQDESCVLLWKC